MRREHAKTTRQVNRVRARLLTTGLTNLFGALTMATAERIRQLVDDPARYWARDYGLIIADGSRGPGPRTLWQAVIAVDASFPTELSSGATRWPVTPDSETVLEALALVRGPGPGTKEGS